MEQVSWKKPLALAGFLVIFGSFAYWLEFGRKPKVEEAEAQSKKPFQIMDESVATIRLVEGSKVYAFRCLDLDSKLCKPADNSKWVVTEPMKVRADDSNVNSLVSALNNLTSSEAISLAEETAEKRDRLLKEYHLDAAARPTVRRVEITLGSGKTHVLYIGEQHPLGESVFAMTGDGKTADENHVQLVPSFVKSNFDHDNTYWRDKKLMTLAAHQVKSFKLKSAKADLGGERKDGQWLLKTAKDGELAGDIENIDNLLTAVTYLSAKKFVSERKDDAVSKKALAGAKPVVTLTLYPEENASVPAPTVSGKPAEPASKDAAPVVLTFFEKKGAPAKGQPSTTLYATLSTLDPLFELETGSKERIDKDLKDLRLAKLITSMERFTAKRLEFSGKPIGAAPVVLEQKDGKWSQTGAAEPDNDKVQGLLDKLSGNRVKEFLAGAGPAGEQDGLRFTLGDDKNPKKRELVFWQHDGKLYARDLQASRKEALGVDPAIKDSLPWAADFFKKSAAAAPAAPAPGGANPPGGAAHGLPPGVAPPDLRHAPGDSH